MKSARSAAFDALKRVNKGAYSTIALDAVLAEAQLSERDSALAAAIFYGVLEKQELLDNLIKGCVTRPGTRIKPDVRIILRMGIYQLGFMDKIPDNAAVDQSVTLARQCGLGGVSGFINALLRGYIRQGKPVPAEEHGCPLWLKALWTESYGEDICRGLLAGLSGRPPLYARVNTLRTDEHTLIGLLAEHGVEARPVEWLAGALELSAAGDISKLPPFTEGLLHIQDISSQLCCAALGAQAGERILDVCSAPGGKAFTTALLMGGAGEITACDIHPHRVELIASGAKRLGLEGIIRPTVRDGLCDDGITADRVLCDVPCSGLGVIRRKPDIMSKPQEEIEGLPALQLDILEHSAKALSSGGVLVYSTCTLNPRENGDVVAAFLSKHKEFEPLPLQLPAKADSIIKEPDHCRTIFPQVTGGDGFFVARMIKR